MDPFLFSLIMAWLLVHAAEEVPYAVRGKTSPRMAAKLAKARNERAKAGKPTTRRAGARDFFSGLWADAWTDADRTRRRLRDERPVKKAQGRLWWQRAARGGKAIGHALQDLVDWAINRNLPDLPGLDDPTDFAEAAQGGGPSDQQAPPRQADTDDAQPAGDPPPRQQPEPDRREPIRATATRLDEQPPQQPQPPVDGEQLPEVDGELVCDGGATCRNSDLDVQEAIARGLCPGCGGRRELVWNFGGEHGHRPCPDCRGTGRHTPFSTTPRLQLEAANSEENPNMSSNAEAARITQAIEFAAGMANEARGGVTSMETFTESLTAGEVTGRPLELTASGQEIYTQIATVFDQLRAELQRHLPIAESYAAVPDAGNKVFNTDA